MYITLFIHFFLIFLSSIQNCNGFHFPLIQNKHPIFELTMRYDYYRCKNLLVHYKDEDFYYSVIELNSEPRNFYIPFDEDEPDYEKKVEVYKIQQLRPIMDPIIIYINDAFQTSALESKYKERVEHKVIMEGKQMKDVAFIQKVEERRKNCKVKNCK